MIQPEEQAGAPPTPGAAPIILKFLPPKAQMGPAVEDVEVLCRPDGLPDILAMLRQDVEVLRELAGTQELRSDKLRKKTPLTKAEAAEAIRFAAEAHCLRVAARQIELTTAAWSRAVEAWQKTEAEKLSSPQPPTQDPP